jgi:UMF1 family MFS transporter
MLNTLLLKRKTICYALYDWGNSAFATTVMAGFFPVFFKQYWSIGTDATVSTARLGFANAAAGLVIALLAPLLGAISDRGIHKLRFLLFFTLLGAAFSAGLCFVPQGYWLLATLVYVVATIGFIGSNLFSDALLVDIAPPAQRELVSAFGYAAGYLGGGLLFALNVLMTLKPALFGLASAAEAVQFSFLSVGLWWLAFGLPIQSCHLSARPLTEKTPALIGAAFRQLRMTLRDVRAYRPVAFFLLAYWLYIDGVHTIIKMAVDYGLSLGLGTNSLITALLITQFVGFPAALAFGWLAGRVGTLKMIRAAILVYLGVTVYAAFIDSALEFYLLAVIIGLVQGGIQALSRAFFANLIPLEKSAEFFGFYNMVGKFAAIIGPALVGLTGLLARQAGLAETSATRVGISSVALMFIAGWLLLGVARRYSARECSP